MSIFSADYLQTAERVFHSPNRLYSWNEIILGTCVRSTTRRARTMYAVAQNTFRGFHRSNKDRPGAKEAFMSYFVESRAVLVKSLGSVHDRPGIHQLANRISTQLRSRLTNVIPQQLASYNKIRKPVDLYLEHLIAMAHEVSHLRKRLIPLLFLPLDSQILQEPELFTEQELKSQRLRRKSTYAAIKSESTYQHLQELLEVKARIISSRLQRPFVPID
ncbi:hypothetical protein AYO47_02140, partial [Planctomyces sp. SCGC AG-212-M04]